jgi:hypothetical protein
VRPWGGSLGRIQALTTVLGAALISLAWWGASGSGHPAGQLNWLSLAAGGVVVAGLGHALFLLDAHRRVTMLRLATLVPATARPVASTAPVPMTAPSLVAPSLVAPSLVAPSLVAPSLVAVAKGRRYHRPGCHLVAGKATTVVPPVRVAGLLACEICQP